MPTVSVVVPFRDRIAWVAEAAHSVLAQTFDDLELILVDDGSTEDQAALDLRDSRVRYVRQEARGRSAARNRGVSAATGTYVAFLDSDDLFLPRKLALQVSDLERARGAVLCHTSYERVTEDLEHIDDVRAGRFAGRVSPGILFNCPIATSTVLVRRSALLGLPFPEDRSFGEDVVVWAQLARKWKFVGIDEPLARVRMHGRNAILDPTTVVRTKQEMLASLGGRSEVVRRQLTSSLYLSLACLALEPGRSDGMTDVDTTDGRRPTEPAPPLTGRPKRDAAALALRSITAWPFRVRTYATLARAALRSAGARGPKRG